jgi:hypothetical protein
MLNVLPMEKYKLELVTSTCAMSGNVLLHDCTRHIIVEDSRITVLCSKQVVL